MYYSFLLKNSAMLKSSPTLWQPRRKNSINAECCLHGQSCMAKVFPDEQQVGVAVVDLAFVCICLCKS